MTGLNVFAYAGQQVRTVVADGGPWFVAADLARVLGYSATEAMTRSLDMDEKGMQTLHTPGGQQSLTVVNEPGLYSAIIRSTLPSARDFKRWVTHEVLPTIRRTGGYLAPSTSIDPTTVDRKALALAVLAAEEEIERQAAQIVALAPRAEAWDDLAAADGDYSVADASKMLARAGVETGPQRLFDQLADLRWTFRGGDRKWRAYASAVDDGYLSERPQSHHHPRTGELILDAPQLRVTLRGLERLRVRLGKQLAVSA
ncbi:MAG TPA: BRO family protein [Candidatus Lumbricidophila sp.]|nr:BRO family protein [Candidatus Lumbricidophila sp.]